MNILIVKLSAIGDVIHTLPAFEALRSLYPHAHISWVVEEAAADILEGYPCLDRIIVSGRKRWMKELLRPGSARQAFSELSCFIRTIRDRRYDLVIDFHGLFKSSLVVLLSGGRRRLGYDSLQELSGLFLTEKIPEDMTKHAVDRYLDFPRHLGWSGTDIRFRIAVGEEQERSVRCLLASNGIDINVPFVAVNPVAYWPTKLWDERKFARLLDRVVGELGVAVVLTGGAADTALDRIESLMRRSSVNLRGKTTLRELAYLYSRSRVVVTTDSGPMHIAAAMGTPTVALFGPTDPVRTGPYGLGHTVIRAGLPCSPCFKKRCEHRRCMVEISETDVFKAVATIITGG